MPRTTRPTLTLPSADVQRLEHILDTLSQHLGRRVSVSEFVHWFIFLYDRPEADLEGLARGLGLLPVVEALQQRFSNFTIPED
jgi:hypothetical protein